MLRDRRFLQANWWRGQWRLVSQPAIIRITTVMVVAVVGLYLLHGGHAATFQASSEAESGLLSGDASIFSDSSASGGSGVLFGSLTPSDLQVFTGGNNIALVWNMPLQPVQSVQVWRNNTQIATVSPNSSAPFQNGQLGKEYDDNSVTAGSTYQYKVRAVSAYGAVSAFSPTVSATQPTSTQPVPTITVNTSAAPSLASYMTSDVVPLLKTWYPKVADEIAYPTYTAPTSYTITFQQGLGATGDFCNTTMSGSSGVITCDPDLVAGCAAAGQSCAATFVHESTHVIQDNASGAGWSIEGGASWGSDFFARQNINNYIPHSGDSIGSYTPGAWFIEYMRDNYDTSFPHDLNVAVHNGTYSDSLISSDTGGKLTSLNQAWQAAVSAYNTSTGSVTGIGSKCTEVQNGTVGDGTKIVLDSCGNESDSTQVGITFNSGISGKCLDDWLGSSTSNADLYTCNSTSSQLWTVDSDGTIKSPSGGCLDDSTNSNGNQVTLAACNASLSTEQWTVSGSTIKNPTANKCLDDPGSSTVDSTALDMTACSGSKAQKWTVTGGTSLSGDFPQQWALTYHDTAKSGFFEITSPNLGNVTGTAYCMDVTSSGTADGTNVQYWGCDQTAAQYWTHGANGTIVNVNSGKCLATSGGASANGTQLIIRACDGGADETWATP